MRSLRLGLLLAVLLTVTACGSGSSPVPSRVRQQVQTRYGSIGFLPTRLPQGYAYREWQPGGAAGFDLYFNSPSGEEIGFHVLKVPCESEGTATRTFEANNVQVKWGATVPDQQAWRCLVVRGTQYVVVSTRAVPGDDTLATPQQRQHAQELVDLVAYAHLPS